MLLLSKPGYTSKSIDHENAENLFFACFGLRVKDSEFQKCSNLNTGPVSAQTLKPVFKLQVEIVLI